MGASFIHDLLVRFKIRLDKPPRFLDKKVHHLFPLLLERLLAVHQVLASPTFYFVFLLSFVVRSVIDSLLRTCTVHAFQFSSNFCLPSFFFFSKQTSWGHRAGNRPKFVSCLSHRINDDSKEPKDSQPSQPASQGTTRLLSSSQVLASPTCLALPSSSPSLSLSCPISRSRHRRSPGTRSTTSGA